MKFETWFKREAGEPPSKRKSVAQLRDDVDRAEIVLWEAISLLAKREKYEASKTYALFAWRLADNDKR